MRVLNPSNARKFAKMDYKIGYLRSHTFAFRFQALLPCSEIIAVVARVKTVFIFTILSMRHFKRFNKKFNLKNHLKILLNILEKHSAPQVGRGGVRRTSQRICFICLFIFIFFPGNERAILYLIGGKVTKISRLFPQ